MTNPQTPQNAAQGADWLDEILESMLEPNSDDETPEGSTRNYRTLVLHDSSFQRRIDQAKAAIEEKMREREVAARMVELDLLEQYINRHFDAANPFIVKLEQEYKMMRLADLKKRLEATQKAKEV